ncbi:MAG: hypothetical protein V7651_06935 [Hyphomonas oceanitis]|uniref:hypothetical protein n=1 Tax=Hyphomonas oceanitis TaxID=81033 RepID=UPI0030017349
MIGENTILILGRLVKGRNKVEQEEMRKLIEDLQGNSTDDVLHALYSPKPKPKKPKAEVPEWLKKMQDAQKKVSWRAPEAIEQLYALADEVGFSSVGVRKRSFPAAAKEVAQQLGPDKTKDLFVEWVKEYVEKHVMV